MKNKAFTHKTHNQTHANEIKPKNKTKAESEAETN